MRTGGFPGLHNNPVVHRMPVNPMDRATLINLLPKEILEVKHTLFPGVFKIPAGSLDIDITKFGILVVEPSSWFKELEDGQPFLEIPTAATAVANSIIMDYCNGLLGCNMGDLKPGLLYFAGALQRKEILEKYKPQLEEAKARQENWMREVIHMADVLWARTQGNPLAISSDAKLFAEILGMKTKPWMGDFVAAELKNCPSCGEMVNFNYPICRHCKAVINEAKAKELNLKYAVM